MFISLLFTSIYSALCFYFRRGRYELCLLLFLLAIKLTRVPSGNFDL